VQLSYVEGRIKSYSNKQSILKDGRIKGDKIMSEEKNKNVEEEVKAEVKTFSEQLEVAGKELVGKVQELIKEGNVRKVIIRGEDGHEIMQFTLTAGAGVAGVFMLAAPVAAPILAAVGAAAAFLAKVKIEIVREEPV
jgi:hypothetical protein